MMKEKIKEDEISMLPNILKETVRGIQPILIEDEMLQHNIKVMDPDTAPRYKKYIPYWA